MCVNFYLLYKITRFTREAPFLCANANYLGMKKLPFHMSHVMMEKSFLLAASASANAVPSLMAALSML